VPHNSISGTLPQFPPSPTVASSTSANGDAAAPPVPYIQNDGFSLNLRPASNASSLPSITNPPIARHLQLRPFSLHDTRCTCSSHKGDEGLESPPSNTSASPFVSMSQQSRAPSPPWTFALLPYHSQDLSWADHSKFCDTSRHQPAARLRL